jgi:Na+/H+-dicarboxylate symporter
MTMTTIPSAAQTNSADLLPESGPARRPRKTPFYRALSAQVLVAMALAIVLGSLNPARGVAMKPLGDAFIRAISMIITLIIFCTVVTRIAGMESLKKVGRIGGMALLYFEDVSTIALVIGLLVANIVQARPWLQCEYRCTGRQIRGRLRRTGQSAEHSRLPGMFRAVVNVIGNGIATLVLARWDGELPSETLRQHLAMPS